MVVKHDGSLVMLKFEQASKNDGECKLEIRIRGKQTNKSLQFMMDTIESLLTFHFPNKIKEEEIVFSCHICGNEMSIASSEIEDFLVSKGSNNLHLACLKGIAKLANTSENSISSSLIASYKADQIAPDLSISSFGVFKIPNKNLKIIKELGKGSFLFIYFLLFTFLI